MVRAQTRDEDSDFVRKRLWELVYYRGMSAKQVSGLIGATGGYVGRFLTGAQQDITLENLGRILRAIRMPREAIADTLDLVEGAYAGWHRTSPSYGTPQLVEEMGNAHCITAVSDDMDSYLLPDPFATACHRRRSELAGVAGDDLRAQEERHAMIAARRRHLRENGPGDYLHHIIGPSSVPVLVRSHDAGLPDVIWDTMVAHAAHTAVGFVPLELWGSFYRHVLEVIPFTQWQKINIADDVLACVWVGTEVWYTYHKPHVLRLRAALAQAVRGHGLPGYPIDAWKEVIGGRGNRTKSAEAHHTAPVSAAWSRSSFRSWSGSAQRSFMKILHETREGPGNRRR